MQIKINDVMINYDKIGEGVPVIMLHGWGVDHRLLRGALEPVFSAHKKSYCRYYPDLPGMGLSDATDNIRGSDEMIAYIEKFISEVIGGESFLLVGNSYGGYLARALILKMPQRIRGLALHVPAFKPYVKTEHGLDKGDVPDHVVIETDTAFMQTLSKQEKDAFSFMSVRQTHDSWLRFRESVLPGIECANQDFLENNLGQNVPFAVDPDSSSAIFDKPVLIMTGRQDAAVGYRGIYSLIDKYPRATFAVLDGCGHNLQTERPVLFERLAADWLERVEACELHAGGYQP